MISSWVWAGTAWLILPFSFWLLFRAVRAYRTVSTREVDEPRRVVARTNLYQEGATVTIFLLASALGAIVSFEIESLTFLVRYGLVAILLLVASKSAVRLWAWERLIRRV